MRLQPDGDLEIAPGELVTVSVTAINTHYLAIFGDLLQADWAIVQPLHQVAPNATQETRSFAAGVAPGEAFSISFDFIRNLQNQVNPGATYQITVVGSGPFRIQKSILPIPPFPIVRPFVFEVRP